MLISWIVFVILLMITVIMLTGNGAFLVAGFNTMSEQEKAKYDTKKISRNAGIILAIVDIALLALLILIQLFLNGMVSRYLLRFGIVIFVAFVLAVAIIGGVKGFKKSKLTE